MRMTTVCRKLAVLCLLAGIAGKGNAQDDVATVRGDVLVVPAVTVGTDQFRIELTILAGTDPIELSLTAVEPAVMSNSTNVGSFSFADNVLYIPSILLGEDTYYATFELVTTEAPFIFRLRDVGIVFNHGTSTENRTPTAMFSVQSGTIPFEIIFDASSSFDPDGEIVQYVWDFGVFSNSSGRFTQTVNRTRFDNEPFSFVYEYLNWIVALDFSSGMEEEVLANNPPVFTARLRVMDNNGATHIFSSEVEVKSFFAHAGQQALVDHIEQAGGWSGRIYIHELPGIHADTVFLKLLEEGVPREHIERPVPLPNYNTSASSTDPDLFVRNFSVLAPIQSQSFVDFIARNNEVVVVAAGNVSSRNVTLCVDEDYPTPRDLWNRNHPFWNCTQYDSAISPEWFDATLAAVETGKVLIAIGVNREEDGSVTPREGSVTCGDLAEYCFGVTHAYNGTSAAAPRVSAVLFHLRQLYDTAEEAVAAAKQCVEDVGEPGPDREFGLGVLDLNCPEAMLPVIQQ